MKKDTSVAMRTVGLDLGDTYSHFCVLDDDGEIVEQGRLRTTGTALQERFAQGPPLRVALEVGTHSPWISRLLASLGHEVIVTGGQGIPAVKRGRRKSDPSDAESLARLARVDPKLLRPVKHRSASAQQDLAVIRSRAALVRARSLLVNPVRGTVKTSGSRLQRTSTASFARQALPQLPEELRAALLPVLAAVSEVSRQIRELERRIDQLVAQRYPEARQVSQVAGVGPITSLAYVLTLEDPRRFRSRQVGAYLGMVPRKEQSGNRDPELRISKAGNKLLRGLLVQSAQYILGPFGPDSDLRRWGLALAKRGGKASKRRALVAVARRLSVLLHALWVSGTEYEPLRQAQAKAKAQAA